MNPATCLRRPSLYIPTAAWCVHTFVGLPAALAITDGMAMTKRTKRILIIFTSIVTVLVLAILLFNWNMLRGPIERKVSAATGREMHINGNLDVDLSLHPLIRIQGITLSNAAWSSQPQMLSIDELAFRIDLMKLLRGQVILPEIHLQKPELLLEEAADGRANWQFKSDQADKGGGAAPEIRELDIRDGQLSYKNPQINTDVTVALNTTADGPDQRPGIRLQGHGRYRGEEFRLHGETGGVLALRDTAHPYPIALEASAGQVRAKVQVVDTHPAQLQHSRSASRTARAGLCQAVPADSRAAAGVAAVPVARPPHTRTADLALRKIQRPGRRQRPLRRLQDDHGRVHQLRRHRAIATAGVHGHCRLRAFQGRGRRRRCRPGAGTETGRQGAVETTVQFRASACGRCRRAL